MDSLYTNLGLLDAMMAPKGHGGLELESRKWGGGKGLAARGDRIVLWLINNGHAQDTDEALDIGNELVRATGLIPLQPVYFASGAFCSDSDCYYLHYGMTMAPTRGLNALLKAGVRAPKQRRESVYAVLLQIGEEFDSLLQLVTMRDGHEVRYEWIRKTMPWRRILYLVAVLEECEMSEINDEDLKKATLFNLYNIMIIHGKLVYGHPRNLAARSKFFNNVAYCVSGYQLKSTELENGLLRLKIDDNSPFAPCKLAQMEPRMHFVLNCGTQSCPPLVAFQAKHTERQLRIAAESYIEGNCFIDMNQRKVFLSRLWKWYRYDFTRESNDDADLLYWLSANAEPGMARKLDTLMKGHRARPVKIYFMRHNWADNGDWSSKPDDGLSLIYDLNFKMEA